MKKELVYDTFIEIIQLQKKIKDYNILGLPSNFSDKDIGRIIEKAQSNNLLSNSLVVNKIIDYYQLLNEKNNFESIDFFDIKSTYELLIENQPYDFSLYESYYYFLNNVIDDEDYAKSILYKGIKLIEDKIACVLDLNDCKH